MNGFAQVFICNIIAQAITFFVPMVMTRALGSKESYATVTYVMNSLSMLLLFKGMGMMTGVLRYCVKMDDTDTDEMMSARLAYAIRCGTVFNIILAAVAMAVVWTLKGKLLGAERLVWMIPLIVAAFITGCMQNFLRTQLEFKRYAALLIIQAVLMLGLSAAGILLWGETGYFIGQYALYLANLVVTFLLTKDFIKKSDLKLDKPLRAEMRKFALGAMINDSMSSLIYTIDVFVVGLVVTDLAMVADYKAAAGIPNILTFLPTTIIVYVYPLLVRQSADRRRSREAAFKLLLFMSTFALVITAVMILLGPLVLRIIYGSEYVSANGVMRVLAIGFFFAASLKMTAGSLLPASGRVKAMAFISLGAVAVNFVGCYVLAGRYGIMGAAVSTAVTTALSGVAAWIVLLKYLGREKTDAQ